METMEIAPPPQQDQRISSRAIGTYATAFLEGMCVIIVEIGGARALAPFFGTSLRVWTAQITMTLFFLAVGYGVGGLLAKRVKPFTVPGIFGIAGIWLAAYPIWRTRIFEFASSHMGVASGSLLSASLLFGIPLLMLGAVSPVLVSLIDRRRPGAGSAAGRLFFTNTMGGLAGGWLTAFLLIPHSSLRMSLVATGVVLLLLAMLWATLGRATPQMAMAIGAAALAAFGVLLFFEPPRTFTDRDGVPVKIVYSKQSATGLFQVIDFTESRQMLVNGTIQGEMNLGTRRTQHDYIRHMNLLAYAHHRDAKNALVLGLGPGLLSKELAIRGVKTTAVEIDPRMHDVAKQFFELPSEVIVDLEDARTFLRRNESAGENYDVIFLDTFTGENIAWYLITVEALEEMKARLNPGGRLVINTAIWHAQPTPGLQRIEATVLKVFKQAIVYPEIYNTDDPLALTNATIVAGENLKAIMIVPPTSSDQAGLLENVTRHARYASTKGGIMTDDRSDLDYADLPQRSHWRTLIWQSTPVSLLWD